MPKKSSPFIPVPEHQDEAVLDQAAPVQNTWYTILDTTPNVRIYTISIGVADTNETLECRITIDGVTLSAEALDATADQHNLITLAVQNDNGVQLKWVANKQNQLYNAFIIEGRSVKVECRKTTAAGAGNLQGTIQYGKW